LLDEVAGGRRKEQRRGSWADAALSQRPSKLRFFFMEEACGRSEDHTTLSTALENLRKLTGLPCYLTPVADLSEGEVQVLAVLADPVPHSLGQGLLGSR
jgi:hypothetical protein